MNLENEFLKVDKYFSPRIMGEVKDQFIKVAKIKSNQKNSENFR